MALGISPPTFFSVLLWVYKRPSKYYSLSTAVIIEPLGKVALPWLLVLKYSPWDLRLISSAHQPPYYWKGYYNTMPMWKKSSSDLDIYQPPRSTATFGTAQLTVLAKRPRTGKTQKPALQGSAKGHSRSYQGGTMGKLTLLELVPCPFCKENYSLSGRRFPSQRLNSDKHFKKNNLRKS